MLQLEPRGAARQLVLGAAEGRRPRNSSLKIGKRVLIGFAFLANLVMSKAGIFCRTRRLPSARIGFLRTSSKKNPSNICGIHMCVCPLASPDRSKRKPLTTPSFLPLLREVAIPLWTRQRSNDGPPPLRSSLSSLGLWRRRKGRKIRSNKQHNRGYGLGFDKGSRLAHGHCGEGDFC